MAGLDVRGDGEDDEAVEAWYAVGEEAPQLCQEAKEYEWMKMRRLALERELVQLRRETAKGKQVLTDLDERIAELRSEADEIRRRKPAKCGSCRAATLQVEAAAQSLIGAAGQVARTLLKDSAADRTELLATVLRYVEPVKHLDGDLEELYERALESVEPPAIGRIGRNPASPSSALAAAAYGSVRRPTEFDSGAASSGRGHFGTAGALPRHLAQGPSSSSSQAAAAAAAGSGGGYPSRPSGSKPAFSF
eukprot:TRINITY_DN31371_c0_g1_i1.p1 TRINITY_DN31371_c0_g1~~TRINITY_DN31371_c0_g1_i1.p1  ORF type:complete len:249 (-),score=74.79 TRINITY_DN31371_c0_g1_i1:31-777(-)